MIYEFQNSLRDDRIKILPGEDLNFPPHLHNNFEFLLVTDGSMKIKIEKEEYELKSGDGLIIFPDRVHEFITEEHSRDVVCLFSPRLVGAFSQTFLNQVPKSSYFRPSSFVCDKILSLFGREETAGTLEIKGILYLLCSEFDTGAEYIPRRKDSDGALISKIFRFVSENYAGDCSLRALSEATSYHYVYLSRYFKSYTGISFIDYVNGYRVNEACYMLENSHGSILKIAYECGFDSLRNFNRAFKKIKGMTPSEYKGGLS